jgi:hypothetical protein
LKLRLARVAIQLATLLRLLLLLLLLLLCSCIKPVEQDVAGCAAAVLQLAPCLCKRAVEQDKRQRAARLSMRKRQPMLLAVQADGGANGEAAQ